VGTEGLEYEWWGGEPWGRDVPFVRMEVIDDKVHLSAGHNDYEVWGLVELEPDIAYDIAYNLIEAARVASQDD
jgi:hypothetical protein